VVQGQAQLSTRCGGGDLHTRPIRVLALVEAETVNGPAKNLLNFYTTCHQIGAAQAVQLSLAPFVRLHDISLNASPPVNEFLGAVAKVGIPSFCIKEGFRFDPRVLGQLREIMQQVDPDVIQTHYSKSHFLLWLSGLWRTRPWIAFHHGHTRSVFRVRLYHGLDRWSLRAPKQVVTVSQAFASQLAAKGVRPEKIAVLHNAIEVQSARREASPRDLAANKARLGVPPGDRLVLAVGRLSKEKAHADLVSAIGRLHQSHPERRLQLIVLGEGTERKYLENCVRSAGLEQLVKLPGHASDVQAYYQAADVVAISSVSEGSPNVLLEAMAAGVPVVATAVGGIPEIVKDREHALLVPPRDPEAMADAIHFLLTDASSAEKMAGAARLLVAERYSPEQRAWALVKLYREVVKAPD
jgi:glycosyltransferase involved in cell wall biosynthesis